MDFGTNRVVKKLFKQKRFHREGEATSCPVITGARPFLRSGQTLGVCFVQKKKGLMGEAVQFHTSFFPSVL